MRPIMLELPRTPYGITEELNHKHKPYGGVKNKTLLQTKESD